MHLCLCESGAALVSVVDPQESLFIEHNVEFLQDSAKSFWIGLYKNHEGEHKVIADNLLHICYYNNPKLCYYLQIQNHLKV